MRVQIAKGESLLQALQRGKVHIEAPCGGRGTCGLCQVEVYGLGKVKSCQFCKPGIYEVKLPDKTKLNVVKEAKEDKNLPEIKEDFLAVDLGTTTVAMAGKGFEVGFVNPQRSYGADVLSRIAYASQNVEHKSCLQEKIQSEILMNVDMHNSKVPKIVVSANSTMGHLLEGLDIRGLGRAPFQTDRIDLHTFMLDRYEVTMLPGISAFVGADMVSGIYETGLYKEEKPMLLLDLGTNGEMALGCKDKLLVTSTSAGPAFEASDLALKLHASGLMALLHKLLDQEIMGDTGLLMEPYFTEGYEGLTQDLIRDLQMAKAAIRAGIEILLKEYKITAKDVDKVYLAGGMGYYINPEDAIAIGLLPEEFEGKCLAVGNTSLKGAIRFGNDPKAGKEELEKIGQLAQELVLANYPGFDQYYIRYMNF